MEVLALLFAVGIFTALVWPEKQQPPPPPKQEEILTQALKELLKSG